MAPRRCHAEGVTAADVGVVVGSADAVGSGVEGRGRVVVWSGVVDGTGGAGSEVSPVYSTTHTGLKSASDHTAVGAWRYGG